MLQFLNVPRRQPAKRAATPFKVELPAAGDDLAECIKKIAIRHFLSVLPVSAAHQAPFKTLITIDVDGEQMPLLIVGTAHSAVEDGSCIAVLNPDPQLATKLSGSWGANTRIFKEAVAKKCDMAIALWIDAYKKNGVVETARYVARESASARFSVTGQLAFVPSCGANRSVVAC